MIHDKKLKNFQIDDIKIQQSKILYTKVSYNMVFRIHGFDITRCKNCDIYSPPITRYFYNTASI